MILVFGIVLRHYRQRPNILNYLYHAHPGRYIQYLYNPYPAPIPHCLYFLIEDTQKNHDLHTGIALNLNFE